jgi:hypothetical protein
LQLWSAATAWPHAALHGSASATQPPVLTYVLEGPATSAPQREAVYVVKRQEWHVVLALSHAEQLVVVAVVLWHCV